MKKRILTLAPLAVLVLTYAPQMHAGVSLMMQDAAGDCVNITNNGVTASVANCGGTNSITANYIPGPGAAAEDGSISANGSLGANFTFNVTTGRGGGIEILPALMNMSSINVDTAVAGTLTITLVDSDAGNSPEYSDLAANLNLSSSGTIIASTAVGSSITFAGLVDSTTIGTLGPFTQPSGGVATSTAANANFANTVGSAGSLTELVTLAFTTGGGEIDSGFTIANAVPEPASIIFLGTAVLGLTGLIRRKQAKRGA